MVINVKEYTVHLQGKACFLQPKQDSYMVVQYDRFQCCLRCFVALSTAPGPSVVGSQSAQSYRAPGQSLPPFLVAPAA